MSWVDVILMGMTLLVCIPATFNSVANIRATRRMRQQRILEEAKVNGGTEESSKYSAEDEQILEELRKRWTGPGADLRAARVAQGLPIGHAARLAGVDIVSYSRFENGKEDASVWPQKSRDLVLERFGVNIEPKTLKIWTVCPVGMWCGMVGGPLDAPRHLSGPLTVLAPTGHQAQNVWRQYALKTVDGLGTGVAQSWAQSVDLCVEMGSEGPPCVVGVL